MRICDLYSFTVQTKINSQHFTDKMQVFIPYFTNKQAGMGGSVECASDWWSGGCGFQLPPLPSRQHSFVEIDHEIFSTITLSLLLIQEGQWSVSDERMCTKLVNCLED